MLYFFDAELGRGRGSRMMGGGIICEQEVTPSEDGANTLLRCFTDLEWRQNEQYHFQLMLSSTYNLDAF